MLVGGGGQKRCFLYIDDAIEALVRIIENKDGCAKGRIFNIGHPDNDISIAGLADLMLELMAKLPGYENIRSQIKITSAEGTEYYGQGYQDLVSRVPNIERAEKYLGWKPTTPMREAVQKTIDYYRGQAPDKLAN